MWLQKLGYSGLKRDQKVRKPLKFYGKEKERGKGANLRMREVEDKLLGWWTLKYVYGLQQRWGGGQKREISLALSKSVTLFSLPFLYIGQSIFLNCFLLEVC